MTDTRHQHDSRASLLTSALRLSYFTIAWNGTFGTVALVVAGVTGSLVLAGFALNALLDSSASIVLAWRFVKERSAPEAAERLERHAQRFVVAAMAAVALYVGVEAVRSLVNGSHADESVLGVAVAAVSAVVLPWLGWRKLVVASDLASPALRGDGVLTVAAGSLAVITLVALLASGQLGWWWADPGAALVIGAALATEAARVAIRHRFG
jgi:divalent metal cation (Fe/Co/Zn/Cd) transporter